MATIDKTEYYLDHIEKVVGIFVWLLRQAEAARAAAIPAEDKPSSPQ